MADTHRAEDRIMSSLDYMKGNIDLESVCAYISVITSLPSKDLDSALPSYNGTGCTGCTAMTLPCKGLEAVSLDPDSGQCNRMNIRQ